MQIYHRLAARWYRLLDPVEDHREEASCYEGALPNDDTMTVDYAFILREDGRTSGCEVFLCRRPG